MKRRKALTVLLIAGGIAAFVIAAYWVSCGRGRLPMPSAPPAFSGESTKLSHTRVVATLDAAMDNGTNVIWCASFQSAWKALENDLAKEPVSLEGAGGTVDSLNRAWDPAPDVPAECLYSAAGWNDKGIVEKIRADLKKKFPGKEPPDFPGILPDSFVAYAYLEAAVRFSTPYFQNREPLEFTCGNGEKANVSSFGIRPEDDYAYFGLRKQPVVLFQSRDEQYELTECIIDLDRASLPNQILLAWVKRKDTLAETLASVEAKIAAGTGSRREGLGPNDILLVPDLSWRVTHRFSELERRRFRNAALKGQRMDVAQQDIVFRLDRSGAELRSESKAYCKPMPTCYVFDRPFLICMKKRGAARPYFVMWVDNAELLRGMPGKTSEIRSVVR